MLADVLGQHPSGEIRWSRLDTSLRDHDGASRLCRSFVFLNHQSNPGHLAGDIEVVGARLGARPHDVLTILAVGADCGDEDARFLNERLDLREVVCVGDLDCCSIVLELARYTRGRPGKKGLRLYRGPSSQCQSLPGRERSGLCCLQSSMTACSFDSERPATAHFKFVGRDLVMRSAVSWPV